MIKDLLRVLGGACVIAGTILYFSPDVTTEDESENNRMKTEISTLQSELKTATEELASLQISLKEAEKPSKEKAKEAEELEAPEEKMTETVDEPVTPPALDRTVLLIEPGMNSTKVASELENKGLIKDASQFEVDLVKSKLAGKIQIGEYELKPSMSHDDIIKMITSSK